MPATWWLLDKNRSRAFGAQTNFNLSRVDFPSVPCGNFQSEIINFQSEIIQFHNEIPSADDDPQDARQHLHQSGAAGTERAAECSAPDVVALLVRMEWALRECSRRRELVAL